jgi:hypothetical protein
MKISRKSFLTVVSIAAGALAFSGVMSDAGAQVAPPGYRWETHPKGNVKFLVPSNWVTTSEPGDVVITKPKDGGLALEFAPIAFGPAEIAKVEAAANKAILARIPDAHTTGPATPVAQNGLSGAVIKGEGTRNGAKVEFFAVTLFDPKGRGLLSVGVAGAGQLTVYNDKINQVFNSIRPLS